MSSTLAGKLLAVLLLLVGAGPVALGVKVNWFISENLLLSVLKSFISWASPPSSAKENSSQQVIKESQLLVVLGHLFASRCHPTTPRRYFTPAASADPLWWTAWDQPLDWYEWKNWSADSVGAEQICNQLGSLGVPKVQKRMVHRQSCIVLASGGVNWKLTTGIARWWTRKNKGHVRLSVSNTQQRLKSLWQVPVTSYSRTTQIQASEDLLSFFCISQISKHRFRCVSVKAARQGCQISTFFKPLPSQ